MFAYHRSCEQDRPGIAEVPGCPLAYTVRGSGPPVLFIRGVGVHGDGWLPQIDQLSATYRCVFFDNPVVSAQLRAMRQADRTAPLGAPADLPTLVVSAVHDPIAPPSAGRALTASIPGAEYVEFDAASHGLPITHAREVNALLFRHLLAAQGSGAAS